MIFEQMPAVREECRLLDLEYMQNLKDQIAYFKSRIQVHAFNPVMRDHCKEVVITCRIELIQCEKEYLSDYGTKAPAA